MRGFTLLILVVQCRSVNIVFVDLESLVEINKGMIAIWVLPVGECSLAPYKM